MVQMLDHVFRTKKMFKVIAHVKLRSAVVALSNRRRLNFTAKTDEVFVDDCSTKIRIGLAKLREIRTFLVDSKHLKRKA